MRPKTESASYFLAKILTDVGDGSFTGEEWWLSDLAGTYAKKDGGRYFSSSNPGWPIDGFTPAVGGLVNVRSGDGVGGLAFELSAAIPGGGGAAGTAVFSTVNPNYAIVADDTWEDTGVSLSIPGAGSYLLEFSSNAFGQVSALAAGISAQLETRFYDVTNAAALNDSFAYACAVQVTGRAVLQNFVMRVKYAATGAATIRVEAMRVGFGNAWTTSVIGNGTNLGSVGYLPL